MPKFASTKSGKAFNIDAITHLTGREKEGVTVHLSRDRSFELDENETIDFLTALKELGENVMPIWNAIWGGKNPVNIALLSKPGLPGPKGPGLAGPRGPGLSKPGEDIVAGEG